MDLFSILILGLVQGIAEWLPISSKTIDAFVFLQFLHGSAAQVLPLVLYLHIGTLLAATLYFRKEIRALGQKAWDGRAHPAHLLQGPIGFFALAILGTGLVGLPLLLAEKVFLPDLQAGALMMVMGAGLLLTALLLHTQKGRPTDRAYASAGWKDGLFTGLMQGLSILPGVSRSGTTTTALLWRGFSPAVAFELSFMLSIPTVMVAEILLWFVQLYQAGGSLGGAFQSFSLIDGLLLAATSALAGYLSIGALIALARRVNFSTAAAVLGLLMLAVGALALG